MKIEYSHDRLKLEAENKEQWQILNDMWYLGVRVLAFDSKEMYIVIAPKELPKPNLWGGWR